MAISPENLNRAFIEEVEAFEIKIDSLLAKKKITKGETISIDTPPGMSHRHFVMLETKYISAGWSAVKWNSEQRDGQWLSFEY